MYSKNIVLKGFTESAKRWFSGKEFQSSEAQTEIAPSPFESRWAVTRESAEWTYRVTVYCQHRNEN